MNNFKLHLSYLGANYQGWQIQKDPALTIQGQLNHALKKICDSDQVASLGSGRTDRGVHALGQIVKATIPLEIEAQGLKRALNSHLPGDIRVIKSESCLSDFHPIFQAKSKEYVYVLGENHPHSFFLKQLVTFYSYPLDWEKFEKGCTLFLGEHDFKNFQVKGSDVPHTIRTISEMSFAKQKDIFPECPAKDENLWALKIRGDGFLRQMVRLIIGALVDLARGQARADDLKKALEGKEEFRAGPVAPPNGLYLRQVFYE